MRNNVTIYFIMKKNVIKELQDYIYETLSAPINLVRWMNIDELPLYLSGQFDFFKSSLSNSPCLFVVLKGMEGSVLFSSRSYVRSVCITIK